MSENKRISHNVNPPFEACDKGDYIFVSYKHDDSHIVYPIIEKLHEAGFNIWFDGGIPRGNNYILIIREKIKKSSLFINFITKNLMDEANNELDFCFLEFQQAIKHKPRRILPIYLEDVELDGIYDFFFDRTQGILKHEFEDDKEFINSIITALKRDFDIEPDIDSKPAQIDNSLSDSKTDENKITNESNIRVEKVKETTISKPLVENIIDFPVPTYREDEPFIYVGYAHRDSNIVFSEIKRFQDMGYNIWYDQGISPGNEWMTDILDHLISAELYVVFITNNAVASKNIQREIKFLISKGKNILPIYLEDFDEIDMNLELDYELSQIQGIVKTTLNEEEYVFKVREAFQRFGFESNKDMKVKEDADIAVPPFKAYEGDEPYIFAAYAHKDRDIVFPDLKRFYDDGFNIWHDEDIISGTDWVNAIRDAILNSSLFVVFITPNSVESTNVRNEIFLAMDEDIPVIPIYLEETQLKSGLKLRLGNLQSIFKYEMSENDYILKYKNEFSRYIMPNEDIKNVENYEKQKVSENEKNDRNKRFGKIKNIFKS